MRLALIPVILLAWAAPVGAAEGDPAGLSPEEAAGESRRALRMALALHRTLWLRDAAVRADKGPRGLKALLERAPHRRARGR